MLFHKKKTKKSIVGFVDGIDNGFILGWALNRIDPERELDIELSVDGNTILRASAHHMRMDILNEYNFGNHGFAIPIGNLVTDKKQHCKLTVAGTNFEIPWIDGLWEKFLGTTDKELWAPKISEGLFGSITSQSSNFVEGWAWSENFKNEEIHVDIKYLGNIVASGVANRQVDNLFPPLHQCGFNIPLSLDNIPDATALDVAIRTEQGTYALPKQLPSSSASLNQFKVSDGARVVGSAEPSPSGAPSELRVLCDGQVVWEGQARRRYRGQGDGFLVDLPDPLDWSKPRTVSVRFKEGGRLLAPDVTYVPKDRFIGRFETALLSDNVVTVRGWICDSARRLDSLTIAILHDGGILTEGVANIRRGDVFAKGIGAHYCGFLITAPWESSESPSYLTLAVLGHSHPIVLDLKCQITEAANSASVAEFAELPSSNADLKDCVWEGKIDQVTPTFVAGWVRDAQRPNDPAVLDLFIDGSLYYSVLSGQRRADVGRKFDDHGNYGFRFELPPHLITTQERRIRISPRYGRTSFENEKVMPPGIAGRALSTAPAAKASPLGGLPSIEAAKPKVAYILLNLNAAHLLLSWFETFSRHNRYANYEILIVDHGSTDDSLALCATWSERLPVRIFARGRNHSFSDSNNFGSQQTDADILVFVNNDVLFIEDIAGEVVHLLADPTIGMVGVKLLDTPLGDSLGPMPIQHLGVHFNPLARESAIQPFESRYGHHLHDVTHDLYDVPAVTGALMACRRADFEAAGGFDAAYFYGYEDVDLCLRVLLDRGQRVVAANTVGAMHMRGFSRGKSGSSLDQRLMNNKTRLHERFGRRLRRRQAADRFERPGFWSSVAPRIAFAVTEASETAVAGDYFTALELASELAKTMTCQIVFLDKENWFDLQGIDVLITMVDNYDLRKIVNAPPHLLRIGWARNWIDRWAAREWSQDYDAMWASSRSAVDELSRTMARPVELVQIATNPDRFRTGTARPELASDYCFTGNYFAAPREIIYYLDPAALPYEFALYGNGWESIPTLAPYSRGHISYGQMPDVYASTRIVIDDANSVTKQWGSVNSRVFDAIAAGALVITNGKAGADELFDGLLPSYANTQELEAHLHHFLTDEKSRRERVAALQDILMKRHTYVERARTAERAIRTLAANQIRFSIKIGAPREAVRNEWGDYHFALGLKRALTRLGHTVRIDCMDRWRGPHTVGDDVVLVLRGLSIYEPQPHQLNLLWIISHPDMIARAELERYDQVFVASTFYAAKLSEDATVPVMPLLQCTDPELFHPDVAPRDPAPALLFAGNSRNVYRPIVRDAMELDLPLEIYGSRWENFVPSHCIKGIYIPNDELAGYYRSAGWVLNDHWDDMRRWGFISNRIFDAVAAGGRVVSDEIAGLTDVFGDGVATYRTQEDLRILLETESERAAEEPERRALSQRIRRDHSFEARASTILGIVTAHPDMQVRPSATHGIAAE